MDDFPAIGIIGCGNMGGALARAVIRAGISSPASLVAYDADAGVAEGLREELGIAVSGSASEVPQRCDVLVLAVKPQVFPSLAPSLRPAGSIRTHTVISVMAGVSSADIRSRMAPGLCVVRVMPNLPLSVGEGATAISADGHGEQTLALVESLFSAAGRTVRVAEAQMDAVTGLSGSGPMYAFEFVEGLVQAGVKAGLARGTAAALAVQTVKGSLKLLEETGEAPSIWTARVCSPGGTTIEALHVLEAGGFRGLLMDAVEAAVARSRALSRPGVS